MTPNIVFLTTGSANSTVAMRMLAAMGWNLGNADNEFAECVSVRRLNVSAINGRGFDLDQARAVLASLTQPWAIKDPRLSQTLWRWRPIMAPYKPMLVWVTKDLAYVQESMRRRFGQKDETWAGKRHGLCQKHFDEWPWPTIKVDVDAISAAVGMWDVDRLYAGGSLTLPLAREVERLQ